MTIPEITTEALQVFSSEEAFHYRLLPYSIEADSCLLCLCEEGADMSVHVAEISMIFGYDVKFFPIPSEELTRLMGSYYRSGAGNVREHLSEPNISGSETDFVGSLIEEAYRLEASDIHLEPSEERCRVRFRIDGKLLERHVLRKADYPAIINRIKIMSNLDIAEKRLPQDGRIMYARSGIRFDIRTSVMPTIHGEKIVLRLLSRDGKRLSLEELGFDKRQYDDYLACIGQPHGLILVSGPTGSGKSTTLYATLERLNSRERNILTIEDPVEYTIDGISQMQLKEDIGLTFGTALRTFLRQDPDIIMLGEIRDEDTARMAVRSSLTGHLLLSTLHTNSAWGCITRLSDMGLHPYLIAETLIGCIAQRLVRLLCPHCSRPVSPDLSLLQRLGIPPDGGNFHDKTGCPHCHYTGYKGRKAIYEVIRMDSELSAAAKSETTDVTRLIEERGIRTLCDSAIALYKSGETSLEEILPLLNDCI